MACSALVFGICSNVSNLAGMVDPATHELKPNHKLALWLMSVGGALFKSSELVKISTSVDLLLSDYGANSNHP